MIPIAYAAAVAEATAEGTSFFSIAYEKMPYIGVAFVILILSYVVGKIARVTVQRAILRTGRHEVALSLVGKSVFIGCIVLGLTVALKITGVDISFIVAAMSLGLGFGMKDLLENYIAGLVILIQEPFHMGDLVKVGEYFGRVEQIQARTTLMRLFDGQRVVIPNSDMASTAVINYSVFPERAIYVIVGISYDMDMSKAIRVVLDALKKEKRILQKPQPLVYYTAVEDSNITMNVRFWIDRTVCNWLEMTSIGYQLVKEAFDANDISWSYPTTTLNVNPHDSEDFYLFAQNPIPKASTNGARKKENVVEPLEALNTEVRTEDSIF